MVLDPFSALAVGAAVAQFLDFAAELIRETVHVKGRVEANKKNFDRELVTHDLLKLSTALGVNDLNTAETSTGTEPGRDCGRTIIAWRTLSHW